MKKLLFISLESKVESLSSILGSEEPSDAAMSSETPPIETVEKVTPALLSPENNANSVTNSPLTIGSSSIALNGSTPTKSEKGLPKAMVKPNILTHVIEGYVIQEANEPFPVTRQRYSEIDEDEPPSKLKN